MRLCKFFSGAIYVLGFTYMIVEVSGYDLIGCYLDNVYNPSFNGSSSINTAQSGQKCVAFCGNSFTYAGVRNGNTCMCGNVLPPDSIRQDISLCDIPCPGATQEKCGGSQFMSVWIIGPQTNKGGMIGGIIGGVLGFLLLLGSGIWWYRKKQRNQKVDNLNTEKSPSGIDSWNTRRRSDVSLRDDFDYTHTLKVTNPDP